MKRLFKILNILISIMLVVIAAGVAFIALPQFGNQALIVRSGSMSPTIDAGSIVVVRNSKNSIYNTGDIIAFRSEKNSKTIVTHRIVGVEPLKESGIAYKTKGDANEEVDGWIVGQKNVLGKVYFTLPFFGKILAFAKSDLGFPLLIIFPAVFVILIEALSIVREIKKRRRSILSKLPFGFEAFDVNKVGPLSRTHQGPTLFSLKVLIPLLVFGLAIPSTLAFFSDSETSTGNVFQAAEVFPTPIPSEPFVDEVSSVSGTFGHCCSDLSSDPSVAEPLVVGAPDSPPDTDFIQISDNSTVTMKFVDNKALPGSGPDIRLHIYDALFPASASAEVSQDGTTWFNLGNYFDTADVDLEIESTGLGFVKYVRLTDLVADGDPFPTLGFDLDAVEALHSVVDP
ncbi:MAG: signal peptidase I [Candidatus Levybacteria bacterium]|nr:signal peptidase I [Candidatus Levybacteria bacterium]